MATKQQVENFTEEVICSICLDFFTDPVSLECGHNFCRSCITQSWEKEQSKSCPECREEFQEIILRVNRALVSLAEKARKLNLNPTYKGRKLHCEEHQEELKLFCETDKKLICLICRDAREHKSHNFMPIKEAVEIYKRSPRGNQRFSNWNSNREQKISEIREECCQKRRVGDDQTLTVQDEDLTMEECAGPLPFPVWQEMFDDIHPVSVTLDVETANQRLEVSEDRKSVRRIRTRRDLPDTGKRFTVGVSVLGSEGFTSGRHYWEVEVAGNRRWSLGVAVESVERKNIRLVSTAVSLVDNRGNAGVQQLPQCETILDQEVLRTKMASKYQAESWTEEAICPICMDFFTDPVLLECGHNFCRSCITQCWERTNGNSCPECREEFKEVLLRVNRALARLAEKARKLKLNPIEKESKLHCEQHQEELKLFCETDKKLICLICRDSREHKYHNFMPIKEAVEIYKNQVRSSLTSLTERKLAILKMEQHQKQKISEIQDQSRSLESHISAEFTKIHESLTEKEQRLIGDLRKREERIVDLMERNLQEIQKNLTSIEEELSTLQKQMEQRDGVIFLKEEPCRKRRIAGDQTLTITDVALTMEEFNGPLPFPVWREMFDDIHPVSVILDVETVSPGLKVSEDLKSVRWTQKLRRLPDTGKRFTVRACVLGLEGFTSGRHYWEVEVAGNQGWSLGVAAESVERKRWVALIPENGFWTIGRWSDGFYVNTSPQSPLPAGPITRRVGVYLSYESGTVSFYSADTKSHLHTFTGNKFTGKIYPFFGNWDENKWLRICSGSAPDLNMASKHQVESWMEEAICAICLDFFTDPVSLECGHNFCRSCITRCWERTMRNSCPECREEFKEIILKVNRPLMRLAEKARKLNLNPAEKESKHCEEHQEELKLFCETDKKLICLICRDAREHKSHNFMPIKEAVEIYKDQMKSFFTSFTEKKLSIVEMEQQQKQKISEIRDQSRSLESHISSEFTKIHQSLTEKEQRLIRDLRKHEQRVVDLMKRNLREIQKNLTSIEEEISTLQKQMEQKDGVIFLKTAGRRRGRTIVFTETLCNVGISAQEIVHVQIPSIKMFGICRIGDDQTLTVMDGALTMEEFMGPLPLSVWREMLNDIQPVSVTLDVETAAPWLEVSDHLKSVRRTGTLKTLPDTGKRFTVQACVLGSEGFTSGGHYWEVEVAGNIGWCLGVAAESVERAELVSLTPETGVWSIERWDDQFNVKTSPPPHLPADPIPEKVGIYLSYESGTVSFYSGNTKSHLHTFTGNKFTEKLYPFFWIGDENKWLRICSGSAPGC
ncbi:uncharacterized protein LOC127585820 [Pristis pectinata]|uniref:uncharacterized protein LOC127585820 n=1 Tax=Pristis pectinata TaxID=685728 RepID=UPI00223D0DBC|nr:uncharacterized protein LOC127585820 [Pristis pectinata]